MEGQGRVNDDRHSLNCSVQGLVGGQLDRVEWLAGAGNSDRLHSRELGTWARWNSRLMPCGGDNDDEGRRGWAGEVGRCGPLVRCSSAPVCSSWPLRAVETGPTKQAGD